MLGRIVNVIKESELDRLSTPWAVVGASHLLSRWCMAVMDLVAAGDYPKEGGAATPKSSQSLEIDELIFMKENVKLGPIQMQILECKTKPLVRESAHVMVKASESQLGRACIHQV